MDLVTGPMGALSSMVLQLLKEDYKLQAGVKDNVESLSKELESMHAALSMVAQVRPEKLDARAKLWARDFREASYDMEDILDAFLVRVDGGPKPPVPPRVRQLGLLSKMAELFCLGKVLARREIGTTILGFIKELKDMDERHGRCRVDHLVRVIPDGAETSCDPRISHIYDGEASELVGIDEPRDAVIQMLDEKSSKKMKVVSIFGSGGLGKTTLAKAVYHKVNLQFDCRASVSVGQNPDRKKVLRDILIDLFDNEAAKEETIDHDKDAMIHRGKRRYTFADLTVFDHAQLIKQLREFLKGKRYLVVVDDIWDTDTWEVIMKPAFVESNCGSRIIVTTRMSDVAETIGEPYEIQQLSDGCSRKLLSKIIFGTEDELENDEVAEKIIHKCHGLPLAIAAIGRLLAPPKQRHEWSNVYESIFLNSIGLEPDKNPQVKNVTEILSFSYYHLPCHLRTCMLYLSVFPEDEYVEKNMLIWRWIAEGLVREEERKGPFEVGDSYFRELINRGLIQPSKDGVILGGCRVHDFVLRLIRKLSRDENFVFVLDSEQALSRPEGKVRRLALQNISETEGSRHFKVDHIDMSVARSFNAMYTNEVPPIAGFELLRVLALEYCWVEQGYLKLIGKLRHLRYLGLTGTPTGKLPEEVGDLKFLQTLMLHETGIEELPSNLEQRTQLMCLRCDEKTRVPEWIGKMTSLVEPQVYPGAKGKCFVQELGKLRHVRVLKTQINLQDKGEARDLLKSLNKLEEAESIVVVSTMGVIRLREDAMQPDLVLNCKNVSVLELRALIFPSWPAWINAQDLPKLNKLCLCVGVLQQQDMEILGKFQQLHDLSISGPIPDGVDSIIIGGGVGFQNLATLTSSANIKFAAGAMPRLETIKLWINAYDLLNVKNHVLNLGLGNIYSLQHVTAIIVCSNCFPAEVEELEAEVKHVLDIHPNWPTLSMMRYGEDGMATTDSGLLDRWKIKELEIGIRLIKQLNLHTRLLTEVELVYRDSMAVPHRDDDWMKLLNFLTKSWDRFQIEIHGEILYRSEDDDRDYRLERDRFWDQYKEKLHNHLFRFEQDRDVHRVKENIAAMQQMLASFTVETGRQLARSWERLKSELRLPALKGAGRDKIASSVTEGTGPGETPAVTAPEKKGNPIHLFSQ